MKGSIRVLHCPTDVGSNPQYLARAERAIGLQSTCISLKHYPMTIPPDEVVWKESDSRALREIKRWCLVRRAMKDFDIVHYNFGHSIMPVLLEPVSRNAPFFHRAWQLYARAFHMLDLPILRELGKGLIVTYQGDDARQGDFCRSHFKINAAIEVDKEYYSAIGDHRKRAAISTFNRNSHRIYSVNPDLLNVLPPKARFIPYAAIDLSEWRPLHRPSNTVPLVVHAPTHRGVKGTRYVLSAIERLQKEGIPFAFKLIENVPRSEILTYYSNADLLIDQLLLGWYGGLALEFMALEKPVVCYIREEDLRFLPAGMAADLPIIQANPESIYSVLKTWLTDRRQDWQERGRQGRAFVERWHDPLKIASQLADEYRRILDSRSR